MDVIKILLLTFLAVLTNSYGQDLNPTEQNPFITDSFEITTEYKSTTDVDIKNVSGNVELTTLQDLSSDMVIQTIENSTTDKDLLSLSTEIQIVTTSARPEEEEEATPDGQKSTDLIDGIAVTSGGDEKLIVVTPFSPIDDVDEMKEEKIAIVTAINEDTTVKTTESYFDENFVDEDFYAIFQEDSVTTTDQSSVESTTLPFDGEEKEVTTVLSTTTNVLDTTAISFEDMSTSTLATTTEEIVLGEMGKYEERFEDGEFPQREVFTSIPFTEIITTTEYSTTQQVPPMIMEEFDYAVVEIDKNDTLQDNSNASRDIITEINIVEIVDGQRLVRTFPDQINNDPIVFHNSTKQSIESFNLILETTPKSEEIIEDLSSFMEIDRDFLDSIKDDTTLSESESVNDLENLPIDDMWKSEIVYEKIDDFNFREGISKINDLLSLSDDNESEFHMTTEIIDDVIEETTEETTQEIEEFNTTHQSKINEISRTTTEKAKFIESTTIETYVDDEKVDEFLMKIKSNGNFASPTQGLVLQVIAETSTLSELPSTIFSEDSEEFFGISTNTPYYEEEISEPFITGRIRGKFVNFTVKIRDGESIFFIPPEAFLTSSNPLNLNITWRSLNDDLNNSLTIDLDKSDAHFVQLNVVKDSQLYVHKKIGGPIFSDEDKSQPTTIKLQDDLHVVLSNIEFWESHHHHHHHEGDVSPSSPITSGSAAQRSSGSFVLVILGGCLGCTLLIAIALFYLVRIVKGRKTHTFKPNNELIVEGP